MPLDDRGDPTCHWTGWTPPVLTAAHRTPSMPRRNAHGCANVPDCADACVFRCVRPCPMSRMPSAMRTDRCLWQREATDAHPKVMGAARTEQKKHMRIARGLAAAVGIIPAPQFVACTPWGKPSIGLTSPRPSAKVFPVERALTATRGTPRRPMMAGRAHLPGR